MKEYKKFKRRQMRFYLNEEAILKIIVSAKHRDCTLSDVVETELMKLDISKADTKAKDNDKDSKR